MFALLDLIVDLAIPILVIVVGLNRVKNDAAKKAAQKNQRPTTSPTNRKAGTNQRTSGTQTLSIGGQVANKKKSNFFGLPSMEELVELSQQGNKQSKSTKTIQNGHRDARKSSTTQKQSMQASQQTMETLRAENIENNARKIQERQVITSYLDEEIENKTKRKKTAAQKALIHYEIFSKPKSIR